MGYMKKYTCPTCKTTKAVIRQRKRGRSIVYLCDTCHKYFSVKTHWLDTKQILSDHLDGISFRRLAVKYGISKSHASDICYEELKRLPDNNQFTHRFCERFGSVLMVDGKYFTVKGYKYGYALLWGVDYFRHDIPIFVLAPSENYQSWAKYFSYFRIISHHPQLLVCDDNANIKMAARHTFLEVRIQTCYNHFKENIRRDLKIRSDKTNQYRDFMRRIESILDSSQKLSNETFNHWLSTLYRDYYSDPLCLSILTNIERYKAELLAYRGIPKAPLTSNLMESFNSHLESRLFSLKYFNSVAHAKLWMNGYILKRRMTKFTSCGPKFAFLNGKTGVQMTQKHGIVPPTYFI